MPETYEAVERERNALRNEVAMLRLALSAQPAEPKMDKLPPGKITAHWMQVAYDRICAGEPEREVMDDYGYHYEFPAAPPAAEPKQPVAHEIDPKLHPWWCKECCRYVSAGEVRVHVLIHLRAEGLATPYAAPPAAEPKKQTGVDDV